MENHILRNIFGSRLHYKYFKNLQVQQFIHCAFHLPISCHISNPDSCVSVAVKKVIQVELSSQFYNSRLTGDGPHVNNLNDNELPTNI